MIGNHSVHLGCATFFRVKSYKLTFYLFTILISFLISFFGSLISSEIASGLVGLISLFFLLPSFAVFVRRLHDIGKSGWNWLLCLIPLIGSIILLVFLCQASEENENKWGEKPIE
ncbi:MAG: DUF805 domain-containing protein [Paludibacteraceae bacterium]|nr:DUF805 domain-containing protein [Paludibacteraceae bacterium]